MNWNVVAAVFSALGIFANVFAAVFIAGGFRQELKESRRRTDEHELWLKTHDTRINAQEVELGRVQEWKDGIKLGFRVSNPGAQ